MHRKRVVQRRRNGQGVSVALAVIVVLGCLSCLSCCQTRKRELVLADFDFLELGMSLDEITCRLGRAPDRPGGSGIRMFEYDLSDGRIVVLRFISPPGVTGARVYEKDGTWTTLLEGED